MLSVSVRPFCASKGQRIHTQRLIDVFHHLIKQLLDTLALLTLQREKVVLPRFRHLLEESGMFHSAGLLTKCGHILEPVVDFLIGFATSPVPANGLVVIEEFDVVKENLGLHHLTRKGRTEAVSVGVNHGKAVFVYGNCLIAKNREGILRKLQQSLPVFLPKLLDGDFMFVMDAFRIFFTSVPEILVKILERGNAGDWDKRIPSTVSHLVFYVALFIAGCQVAEISLEPVMQHEPGEAIC